MSADDRLKILSRERQLGKTEEKPVTLQAKRNEGAISKLIQQTLVDPYFKVDNDVALESSIWFNCWT